MTDLDDRTTIQNALNAVANEHDRIQVDFDHWTAMVKSVNDEEHDLMMRPGFVDREETLALEAKRAKFTKQRSDVEMQKEANGSHIRQVNARALKWNQLHPDEPPLAPVVQKMLTTVDIVPADDDFEDDEEGGMDIDDYEYGHDAGSFIRSFRNKHNVSLPEHMADALKYVGRNPADWKRYLENWKEYLEEPGHMRNPYDTSIALATAESPETRLLHVKLWSHFFRTILEATDEEPPYGWSGGRADAYMQSIDPNGVLVYGLINKHLNRIGMESMSKAHANMTIYDPFLEFLDDYLIYHKNLPRSKEVAAEVIVDPVNSKNNRIFWHGFMKDLKAHYPRVRIFGDDSNKDGIVVDNKDNDRIRSLQRQIKSAMYATFYGDSQTLDSLEQLFVRLNGI